MVFYIDNNLIDKTWWSIKQVNARKSDMSRNEASYVWVNFTLKG